MEGVVRSHRSPFELVFVFASNSVICCAFIVKPKIAMLWLLQLNKLSILCPYFQISFWQFKSRAVPVHITSFKPPTSLPPLAIYLILSRLVYPTFQKILEIESNSHSLYKSTQGKMTDLNMAQSAEHPVKKRWAPTHDRCTPASLICLDCIRSYAVIWLHINMENCMLHEGNSNSNRLGEINRKNATYNMIWCDKFGLIWGWSCIFFLPT